MPHNAADLGVGMMHPSSATFASPPELLTANA